MQANFPTINGLTTKNFTDEADYSSLVAVHQRSKEEDALDELSVLESIPTVEKLGETLRFDHCEPHKDVLLVEIHGEVVGYVRVAWWVETDGTWLFRHNEYLIPAWRGKGIEDAMIEWAEGRSREIAVEQKASGKLMYGTNATDSEKEKTTIILKNGYEEVFSQIEMGLTDFSQIKQIALSDGFEVRPVLPEHLREIWEVNNEVYADRDFVHTPTEEDFQEFKNDTSNDYSLWVVAWHENKIAGLVLSQIEGGRGEILQVSVREKYRRKGLAQALLTTNLTGLKEKGVTVVRLHTSGENVAGAKTLYEKVGFRLLRTSIRYRKGFN